ncbi:MAG: SRPBCC family protein [Kofleriaceae bacterium]
MEARHVSIAIARPPAEVYAYAREPSNLPRWAAGLSGAIEHIDGEWIADSPMGKVKVRFVDENPFGVLDHVVVLPSGQAVYNPMRVVANAEGSEVIFTLFRRPEVSDAELAADAAAVARDLAALKALLEP